MPEAVALKLLKLNATKGTRIFGSAGGVVLALLPEAGVALLMSITR